MPSRSIRKRRTSKRRTSKRRTSKRRTSKRSKTVQNKIIIEPVIKREAKLFFRDILKRRPKNFDKYQHGDLIALEEDGYRNEGLFMIIDDNGYKYPYLTSGFRDDYGHVIPVFNCSNKKYKNAFEKISHNNIRFVRPINFHLVADKIDYDKNKSKVEELINIDKKYGPYYMLYEYDWEYTNEFYYDWKHPYLYRVEKINKKLVVVETLDGINKKIVDTLTPFDEYEYDSLK